MQLTQCFEVVQSASDLVHELRRPLGPLLRSSGGAFIDGLVRPTTGWAPSEACMGQGRDIEVARVLAILLEATEILIVHLLLVIAVFILRPVGLLLPRLG